MNHDLSRREVLTGLAAGGAHLLLSSSNAYAAHEAAGSSFEAYRNELLKYYAANASKLLRPAAGVLRFPSISPSLPKSTYSTSLWDWDTLWTAQGLFSVSKRTGNKDLQARIVAHARGCVQNFFDHQSAEGRIPMLITVENADPLGCLKGRSPHKENQAKPILAQLALLIVEQSEDIKWFASYFDKLLAFYKSWTDNNQSRTGLLVWGDDVAIGNDNDPTTFGRPFFSSANLLLNCLYFKDMKAAEELARRLNRMEEADQIREQGAALAAAIQSHCWDPRDKFYYTADVQCVDMRAELIPLPGGMAMSWKSIPLRIQTFTGFLPMWCEIASKEQAGSLVKALLNPLTFFAPSGVRTLSASETMYSLEKSSNPSNWLGPIWIISNYLTWKGLDLYGYRKEAASLAHRTMRLLAADLARNGSLNEYYHPESGAPLSHSGFMDWNLLALEMH